MDERTLFCLFGRGRKEGGAITGISSLFLFFLCFFLVFDLWERKKDIRKQASKRDVPFRSVPGQPERRKFALRKDLEHLME
jgi:hypothetical protein